MTRKQFADWLTRRGACDPAMIWLASVPGRSIRKVWYSCPEPGWLLWWLEIAYLLHKPGGPGVSELAYRWLPPEFSSNWLYPDWDNLAADEKAGAVEDIREIFPWKMVEAATQDGVWS